MSDRIVDLQGLQPQIEVISPEESANRGMRAMRQTVREQGQVMSAALENNHNLFYTNKRLRLENQQLSDEIKRLAHANSGLAREVERLKSLQNPNAEEFEAMQQRVREIELGNKLLRDEMVRQLSPELTEEERKAALQQLQQQKRELEATGLIPGEDWINATPEERAKMAKTKARGLDNGEAGGQPTH